MGGVFFIDEVNKSQNSKYSAYIFLMGLSGGQNKAILMQ